MAAALIGAAVGSPVEWYALASGRWSYTNRMPLMPALGIGLLPVLQLALLVPASIFLAACLAATHRGPKETPG